MQSPRSLKPSAYRGKPISAPIPNTAYRVTGGRASGKGCNSPLPVPRASPAGVRRMRSPKDSCQSSVRPNSWVPSRRRRVNAVHIIAPFGWIYAYYGSPRPPLCKKPSEHRTVFHYDMENTRQALSQRMARRSDSVRSKSKNASISASGDHMG